MQDELMAQEEIVKRYNLYMETKDNREAIKTDLFQSKEEALLNWCRHKGFFSKAEVFDYGVKNYYISSYRRIQELVKEGRIRKLSKDECAFRNFRGKMAYYSFVK